MGLDVEPPAPPDLTNRPPPADLDPAEIDGTTDLRRAELERILQDGAWSEAFREWAEYTDLTDAEYRAVRDASLFQAFDFYWDPVTERIRVETPSVPADAPELADARGRVAAELSDLGRTVVEMIEDGYVDWSGAETDEWSEETFREESSPDD